MKKTERNYTLDFLKFIFSVIVVLYHSTSMARDKSEYIFINGRIGVEFFFIVSGCLMCASAMKANSQELTLGVDTFQFIKRKIFSFLPNFIIAYIIAFAVYHYNAGITSIRTMGENLIHTLPDLLLIKNSGIKAFSYNGVTWYLSAMILGMAVLYPLIRKFKDTFFCIIAPLGFLSLMGYLFQNFGSLSNLEQWNGFMMKGTIRAIADMLGGCICYFFAVKLKQYKFTPPAKFLFTALEWGCYLFSILFIFDHKSSRYDYFIFLLFMIGVTITYAQISYDSIIFKHRFFGWLGTYSLSLYLGHSYWRKYNSNIFPKHWDFNNKLTAYLILSVVTSLFIMYTSIGLRKFWKTHGHKIRACFIKNTTE